MLRQDAGSVGELVFGMLYDPWRAVIQLVGSLLVLAWVDLRLLLGALFIIPLVYFTHRTWIGNIRPQHRRIRAQREEVDALATESFGGMRVVRAFGRQRSETNRIMRGNHVMGRQELYAWWWMRVDRGRLGNAGAAGQCRPAALRRISRAAGTPDHGRS